jgi:FkbM family methyltransferase
MPAATPGNFGLAAWAHTVRFPCRTKMAPSNHPIQSAPLVSPLRRLRYALTPKWLYSHYRARRDLRRYEAEIHLLPFLVDPARNAVDAGAHRGSYCYFLARMCRQVYAYEPNPVMREYLKKVVRKNVSISDAGLSNQRGSAQFVVPNSKRGYRNTAGTLETNLYVDDAARFEVPIVRLDDEPLKNVGFIKMDIEGHELHALEGAQQLLQRDRPTMLLEVREELNGKPIEDALAQIEAYGYQAFALKDRQICAWRSLPLDYYRQKPVTPPPGERILNFIFFPTSPAS